MKKNIKSYESIRKIATGQGDDYITSFLLDNHPINENLDLIAIDLSKQQAIDAGWKATQQITFTGNSENELIMLFIIEKAKEIIRDFY